MSFNQFLRLMGCCLVILAFPKSSGAVDSPVSVTLDQEGGRYSLVEEITVLVDPQIAWNVLTDYDHLSQFVHSIRGHIRSKNGEVFLVHQVASGGFLFFTASVEVLLKVHEEPNRWILFKDVSGKDFKGYSGIWTLRPVSQGVVVNYQLEVERNKNTPGFVSGDLLRSATKDLLNEVRVEMERRESKIEQGNKSTKTPVIK